MVCNLSCTWLILSATWFFFLLVCLRIYIFAADFQGFKKPSRLLPASEADTYTKYVSDNILSSVELDTSNSFYMVELKTSKEFGSCLRDLNAAILLSIIDVNGDAILQRISSVSWQLPGHEKDASETIHFQRGSADIVTFRGPKLGKIESLWIGLESGEPYSDKKAWYFLQLTCQGSSFSEYAFINSIHAWNLWCAWYTSLTNNCRLYCRTPTSDIVKCINLYSPR